VTGPDPDALNARVELVSAAMATHGGGLELAEVDPSGRVRVRFTGLCASCQLRPLTFVETIAPALESLPGVAGVSADGARISEHAMARLRHYRAIDPIDSIDFSYSRSRA
jgi:Fe-S cluster biogenesis protein NfuA